ncbi:beta-ketoacyl synthase N-terminal-like domain-containing protein [Streptomyces sp. NPDC056683]|uniref:beta-ketoacyl synthase N-terminal-like domain-containing protein n=1 Tax=Streptomyces sp. NPDC056683 TaxID=3345910 RepID=UPI0036B8AC1D
MATGAVDPRRQEALVISGWAATSPYGLGAAAFETGVSAERAVVRELPDRLRGDGPHEEGGWIPDFDIKAVLGRKGTRSLDRVTALAVSTTGMLLQAAGPGLVHDRPEAIGLVLGSGHGSVKSIMDFTHESLTAAQPHHVDPAVIPNLVMNRAAGLSAIWHTIKGPNVTVSGGSLTGLLALGYATRLVRQGRAEAVLAGAAEEYSAQRSWLEHHSRADGTRQANGPLGEGAVMMLVEPAHRAAEHGRPVLAEVLASRFIAFAEPAKAHRALTRAVSEALKEADATADHVDLVVPSDCGGPLGEQEDAALRTAGFDDEHPARVVRLRALIGDTSAAASAFQLATALSHRNRAGLALITSIDPDGNSGCTLLRLPSAPSAPRTAADATQASRREDAGAV